MSTLEFKYRGLSFFVPALSTDQSITLAPSLTREKLKLQGAHTLWDQERFKKVHPAIEVDYIVLPYTDSLRILDLPIKLPGDNKIQLPIEGVSAERFVKKIIDIAAVSHPKAYENSYAYLTIDNGVVKPNTYQRQSGLHVDGFQGARIGNALPTDFSYIAVSGGYSPTLMYPYSFETKHLDRAKDNFHVDWTNQARDKNLIGIPIKRDTIYGMSAYTIHEAGINTSFTPHKRTFMRLSFSVREFDRLGNTPNPLLNLNWDYVPRDVTDSLK